MFKRGFNSTIVIFFLVWLFVILGGEVFSQCPMCRIAAETNLEDGGLQGKGLNTGILYMLTMPYIFVGTLAFIWYKNRKKPNETSILPRALNN